MTETQLKLFPAFKALPIFDESDERSHALVSGPGGRRATRECTTLAQVQECLANPRLVPLGAVRVGENGNKVVVVYFGEET